MTGARDLVRPRRGAHLVTSVMLVAAIVAGLGIAPERGLAAACPARGNGSWTSIQAPAKVNSFTVLANGNVVAADDRTLFESSDAGCTWGQLWRLPGLPSAAFPWAGEKIALVSHAGSTLYLALSGPHVLTSSDGGRSWTTADNGLVPGGIPSRLAASPRDPSVLYLTVTLDASDESLNNGVTPSFGNSVKTSKLYSSRDGGRTWAVASTPFAAYGPRGSGLSAGSAPGTFWDVEVDPLDAGALWAATSTGLFFSGDGGESWTAEVSDGKEPDVRAVDVQHAPKEPPTVIAVAPASGTVFTSTNGAAGPWAQTSFAGFKSILGNQAFDPMIWLADDARGDVLASGPKGVFRRTGGGWTDISPLGLGSGYDGTLVDLMPDPGSAGTFWGRARVGSTIYRFDAPETGSAGADGDGPLDRLTDLTETTTTVGALARRAAAHLSPAETIVRLEPGESVTRSYALRLPPRPTPLDVYFLLDSTASMSGAIRSLARGAGLIATKLRADGIDVWVGLGEFRTYPLPREERLAGEPYNFPYRRDLAVTPPGARLADALLAMEGDGTSGANLTALYQSVTGAGQDVIPPGSSGADVAPGLDAHFRDGARRVIVHAADTWFGTPERGDPSGSYPGPSWPGPGFDEVIAALAGADVHQVGAAIGVETDTPPRDNPNVIDDLRRVALGTGTSAPREGVDCDADGTVDLREGAPLVCGIPYSSAGRALAPAIASLLESIRDVAPVRLVEQTESGVVATITPSIYPTVDLKDSHRLRFNVTFSCTRAREGKPANVRLDALVGPDGVAGATARVVCHGKPVPPLPPAAFDPPPVAAAGLLPLPPPPPPPVGPPGPVHAPAPAAEPAPAPAQAPAGSPQGVLVQQRQAQPQVALVHAARLTREQLAMEHAMVRFDRPRGDPLATTKYGLAMGVLSVLLLWGMATAPARRPNVQTVGYLRRSR